MLLFLFFVFLHIYFMKKQTVEDMENNILFDKLRYVMLLLGISLGMGAWAIESKTIGSNTTNLNEFTIGNSYNITFSGTTFSANVWELFGLPFDASKEVLDQTFGEGNYQLRQYRELNGNMFVFSPMESLAVEAGKPYMIKLKTAVVSPVFNDVTMKVVVPQSFGNDNLSIVIPFLPKAGWDLANNYKGYVINNGSPAKVGWGASDIYVDLPAPKGFIKTDGNAVPQINANNGVREQLSNVPTVYIDIPDVINLDTDLKKDRTTGEALWHRASIQVIATTDQESPLYLESFTDDHLQIKVRGNATADPSKRAYRLKFDKKDSITGQNFKHDLLGKGYKKRNWILKANAFDNSMLRDAVMTELGEYAEMDFVPGYKYVDLFINGDYRGTYMISDHAEVGSHRIPVDEDTGWYVEFQGRGDMLDPPMCFSSPLQMNVKNPEPEDETDEAQRNAVMAPMQEWFADVWSAGWNDATLTDPAVGWRAYNDEESWLKFILVTELTGDYDGYMTVKAYREADGKLCLGPIWDKDLAYGNITCGNDEAMVADIENGTFRAYVKKLYGDSEFINRLRVTFQKMVDDGLEQFIHNKIEEVAATIQETWTLNSSRWGVTKPTGSMQVFDQWTDHASYVNQLKQWLTTRISFLQEQYVSLSEAAGWQDIVIDEPVVLIGDANDDGVVDVTDVAMIVNYILGKTPAGFNEINADANGDGSITIEDVVQVVNIIL